VGLRLCDLTAADCPISCIQPCAVLCVHVQASGGGIHVDPGILQTYRLVVTRNSAISRYAVSGGGVRLSATGSSSAKGNFLSTIIAGNVALGRTSAIGGGLYCLTQSTATNKCDMRGLTVRNNSAVASGASAAEASGTVHHIAYRNHDCKQ
jgi:hypothetical protein